MARYVPSSIPSWDLRNSRHGVLSQITRRSLMYLRADCPVPAEWDLPTGRTPWKNGEQDL